MFSLFYGLYKYLFKKDEFFVLILGLDNAGKTTYLEAAKTKFTRGYKGLSPSKITTTVGQNVGGITYAGIKLSFWDLGGQEELQPLWEKYFKCHAVIHMVDSADRERMDESKEAFDIPECMGVREVKPVFNQSADLIGRRDCMVMPVSALTGAGVDEGIDWLVECIKRNTDVAKVSLVGAAGVVVCVPSLPAVCLLYGYRLRGRSYRLRGRSYQVAVVIRQLLGYFTLMLFTLPSPPLPLPSYLPSPLYPSPLPPPPLPPPGVSCSGRKDNN
ncbi:ADP-ribosylation factor-related protein 1-like, partial [Homarus americanus]